MKKLLVVLLAVVLIFGFAATAMAADTLSTSYQDLNGKTQTVQDAFMKLTALDVFGGYPDGTIRPDANITRAEFAKIACVLSGMSSSADVMKDSASKFSDVAAGQWYTGYINLATSLGFVSGYPDGTYKPNNNISMQEALTVLLRIAGYNDNLVGPWPLNYIAQGGKLDVTDDVAFAGSAAATRASIAVMASNVLDLNIVYWDGDKSKFVEDTQEVDEEDVPITVLEDKFGAISESVTIRNWQYDDFDDQELSINCWGHDNYELAEKYWVTNGNVIWTLGNLQADLLMNDDGEVVFIDVTATTVYSDDVTTEDDSVDVGGDVADYADDNWIDSVDGDYAKVYYNADGDVYAVEALDFSDSEPAVVEAVNATKDRIETYNASNIDTDQDLALIKNGQFITAADLNDGDLLYYIGDALNADEVYVVLSFKEGELTKGTSSALTIGGTALVYGPSQASYSADAMDTFANITAPGDVDDAYDTTVQYATALGNPFDLALLIFEGGESTTIYGIITDVAANIDGDVSAITVLNAEGDEVEYDLDRGDAGLPTYNKVADLTDTGIATDGFNVAFGTYIEAKVSEDGTIDTDNIMVLLDPIERFAPPASSNWINWDADLAGYAGDYEYDVADMDINNNRIQLDGVYYTLNDDTLVFQTVNDKQGTPNPADDTFDSAEVVDVADLMAADAITAGRAIAFIDGGVVKQLFLLNTDLNSSSAYGIIDDVEYYSGDWYAILSDGSVYTTADTLADYVDSYFVSYSVTGGDLAVDAELVEVDGSVYFDSEWPNGEEAYAIDAFYIASANDSLIVIDDGGYAGNYTVNDDTVFYVIEDGVISDGDVYDIEEGETDLIIVTTDTPADDILAYVFILIDTTYPI